MIRRFAVTALLLVCGAAQAQDVVGIEACTHETSMERRTGCLQSNIQYLHNLIAKNAADTQQKLAAAAADSGALKGEVAALKGEIAALRAALATAQAGLARLQIDASKRAPAAEKTAPK